MATRGLRNTRQREAVTDIFFSSDGHFSLDELLLRARERDEGIGYATVYRTLRMLTELGLATERRFSDGQTRYEASDGVHHDHLICTRCGEIREFENEEIEALQEQVAALHGYRLLSHRMELYGLCAACQTLEPSLSEGSANPE
ncbi:MAG: transcriptional repressor [Deltaproteobacteria bacterium]|nr:transcriptional repressor [Deltaproteobacteria bacterium]